MKVSLKIVNKHSSDTCIYIYIYIKFYSGASTAWFAQVKIPHLIKHKYEQKTEKETELQSLVVECLQSIF